MTTNKGVNRTFFITVILYLGLSALWDRVTADMNVSFYVNVMVSQLLICLPFIVYLMISRTKVTELIPCGRIKFTDALLCVAMTYLFYPVLIVLNLISMFFASSASAALTDTMQGQNVWLNFLVVAIIPPLFEEFVFRGVLYHTYRRASMLIGIVLSGFLFGCMHMNFNQFLYAFVFGMVLVMIVEATGSIWGSVICHLVLNGTSVIMSRALSKVQDASASALDNVEALKSEPMVMVAGLLAWAFIAVFTSAAAIVIWVYIARKNQRLDGIIDRIKLPAKEKCITLSLIAGILCCIAIIVWIEIQIQI